MSSAVYGSIVTCGAALLLLVIARRHQRDYVHRWILALLLVLTFQLLTAVGRGVPGESPFVAALANVSFAAAMLFMAVGAAELARRRPLAGPMRRRLMAGVLGVAAAAEALALLVDGAPPQYAAPSIVGITVGVALCSVLLRRRAAVSKNLWGLAATILACGAVPAAAAAGPPMIAHAAFLVPAAVVVMMIVCIFDDYGEATELACAQIEALAYNDWLTGLPNRSQFFDRLIVALSQAERFKHRVAVLFFDIDRFKSVNDSLGHSAGDALLKAVSNRLRESLRLGDTIARFGGDEFTILLPRLDQLDEAEAVARKVMQLVSVPIAIAGRELVITASIGISVYPDDAVDAESLVRNADVAMYRSKQQGRNTYQLYTPGMTVGSLTQLDLEQRLRRAAEQNELELHYQPQVDLRDESLLGFEALLRWNHPTLGLLPPDHFIPIAELSGAIVPIGEWVLNEACRQVRRWQREYGRDLTVAVNLSPRQFARGELLRSVAAALETSGLAPEFLELEITETNAMSEPRQTVEILTALRDLGVRVAIDDFGTGYSSFTYLQRFPIHTLKLDRSFVHDVEGDRGAIADAIISMGHTLGLKVVAEGVETEVQLDFLRSRGCDSVQGHHYARPLTAAEAAAFLESHRYMLVPKGAFVGVPSDSGRSALVVDDDEPIRRMVGRVLERLGFHVDEADDGIAAMEALARRRYAVTFLDIMMPRADGYQVIEYLKRHHRDRLSSVVVLTAIGPAALERVAREPVGRVVAKPFDITQIVAAANECAWQSQRVGAAPAPSVTAAVAP